MDNKSTKILFYTVSLKNNKKQTLDNEFNLDTLSLSSNKKQTTNESIEEDQLETLEKTILSKFSTEIDKILSNYNSIILDKLNTYAKSLENCIYEEKLNHSRLLKMYEYLNKQ